MTTLAEQQTTLVIGGTGKTGRRVARRLGALGVPTRLGTRTGAPPFDWQARDTWGPALTGVRSAYLCYSPDVAAPGAADTIGDLAALAVRRGVRRLVLLSGRGDAEARRAELAVQRSGAAWTVVRSSWFAQNFSEGMFGPAVLRGEVALPVDGVPEPFVDVGDVAEVAAAALTGDGHDGQVYEVTGPRLLTFADAVGEVARASGRDVRFRTVTLTELEAGLAAQGVPAPAIDLTRHLFTDVLDGRNASLADGVQRALGREPRDFADYARAAAAAGAWDAAPAGRVA
ncbi:NmrA family transcriptional regulator [Cellulomonas sp. NS3]|uniref:NmrA family transcriptional regulator n=1 Tax=Cellulomonas sp. NS3 TaxID=2973977 RepID=UPI0021610DFD|nr:NmrA family transcriptional regulator [Cellulomonas sp. NS3]